MFATSSLSPQKLKFSFTTDPSNLQGTVLAKLTWKWNSSLNTHAKPQAVDVTLSGAATVAGEVVAKSTSTITGGLTVNGNVNLGTTSADTVEVSGTLVLTGAESTPSAADTPACSQGDIAYDTSFVYICVATNEWKKLYIDTWWSCTGLGYDKVQRSFLVLDI